MCSQKWLHDPVEESLYRTISAANIQRSDDSQMA